MYDASADVEDRRRALVLLAEEGVSAHATVDLLKADEPLLAAAPELYEALKDIVDDPHATVTIGDLDRAKAALARARGEEAA